MFVGPSDARAGGQFVAEVTLEFVHPEDPGFRMPTDVAVAPDGTVFVADGSHNRISRFDAAGVWREDIRAVGDHVLASPVGLDYHADAGLWIADSGNHQALLLTPAGALGRKIVPLHGTSHFPPDITDVVTTSDGTAVWLVDNDNNHLIRWNLIDESHLQIGEQGESLGSMQHPFLIARNAEDDVLVTDVINGRVSVFSGTGSPRPSVGAYGIEPGQLYRPKGVACDTENNVWVSDGTLNVIQVFSKDGSLLDVLRGSDGKPMKFEFPMGITFDGQGRVYVVELLADRVVRLEVKQTRPSTGSFPQSKRTKIVGGQARSCTVCHIEWIEPFSRGVATALADSPPSTDEQPAASRGEMCLSCHDASVVDSRHRVWDAHGHRTGVAPPSEMKVPAQLPLVNGEIACRTCHSAHAGGAFMSDFRTAVFLRMPNQASELCISCHQDKTRGPEFGTHPVGGMPWVLPRSLVAAGAFGRSSPGHGNRLESALSFLP